MNRITIGQYYPTESLIHRLDARIKLLGVLFFIMSLFFVSRYTGYIVAALAVALLIRCSHVPVKLLIRGLKSIIFIVIFAATLNIFFTPGETVVFSFYFLHIKKEGLLFAGKMAFRLILLVMGSSLLTLTTSPLQLTDAIEQLLKPLKKIKVPAHEIAMMMTIALRFIPTLMDETEKIMKAQTARGADFDTGGLVKKAKGLIPLLVPLFVSAFQRASDLAVAMDARCYRGDYNRTKMKVLRVTPLDYAAVGCMAVYGLLLFLACWR